VDYREQVAAMQAGYRAMVATRPDGTVIPERPSTITDAAVLNAFTKGLAPALDGFRRKGRVWQRSTGAIVTGIHARRLRVSYGVCAWVRLEPSAELLGANHHGPHAPPGSKPEWRIFNGGADVIAGDNNCPVDVEQTGAGLDIAVREACTAIERDILPWLDAMSSPEHFYGALSEHWVGIRIDARLAFGQLAELADELATGPPPWNQQIAVSQAASAARGYTAVGKKASPEWRAFIEQTLAHCDALHTPASSDLLHRLTSVL
jgi:hypothetical protein